MIGHQRRQHPGWIGQLTVGTGEISTAEQRSHHRLQLAIAGDLDVTAGQGGEGLLAQLGLQRIPGLSDRRAVLAAAQALKDLIKLLQQGQQQLPATIRVQTLNRQQTAGGIGQSSLN